jgi:hypothetical protein
MSTLQETIKTRQNITDKLSNPAQYFLKWSNGSGEISYYDKEKKENIIIGNNISFLLLDQLSTAKGWDSQNESAIIGTEVRNPAFEPIILRSYKDGNSNQIVKGIWKTEIKDKYPVDFYASLYIVTIINSKPVLANLQIKGACLADLFEAKLKSVDGFYINFKKGEQQKNGVAKWFSLSVSKTIEVPKIIDDLAVGYYNQLQDYLDQYLAKKQVSEEAPDPEYPAELEEITLDEAIPDMKGQEF